MIHYLRMSKLQNLLPSLLPYLRFFFWGLLPFAVLWALYLSPPDIQHGPHIRIMYVHVPCAWLSMMIYSLMALFSFCYLVWKIQLMPILTRTAAPLGTVFTGLSLVTGSIWGKPAWGTWWVWDARLTSVFVLFVLYVGYLFVQRLFQDHPQEAKVTSSIALIGAINLPIIKYSVVWWNALHQPASIKIGQYSRISQEFLIPLVLMFGLVLIFFLFCWSSAILIEISRLKRRKHQVPLSKAFVTHYSPKPKQETSDA